MTDKITTPKIIKWQSQIFARFGNPEEIVTDNGPQFISSIFHEFLAQRSILHSRTSLYNPQENGKVERFNRNIKNTAQVNSTQT
ncbi:MAG: transposase family protein [Desulfobacterales bacterium]|nr:transposase family protein [Desulfobacterales bacterium]